MNNFLATRKRRRGLAPRLALLALVLTRQFGASPAAAEEVLPKHINQQTLKAVQEGLKYLKETQSADGGWHDTAGGAAYPVALSSLAGMAFLASGNTPTRGRYAEEVRKTVEYLLNCSTANGLITGANQDSGQPMHGHGFALMFLASVYGMESKQLLRTRTEEVIIRGIKLTATGQSPDGGWTYIPGSGDEGSVTVTQVQALRAAHNAGFTVPRGTIDQSVRYIERCATPEGGIMYSLRSARSPQLAISAAAVATLYNAGDYDSPMAKRCLDYVLQQFKNQEGWAKDRQRAHHFYTHLYAAQAFYMSGDETWDNYFPATRDQLINMQHKEDGSWDGDYIGKTYGTAIALIILQLPYKYLPVYQR